MADDVPGTAAVRDQRTPPRGVIPRRAQTWIMAGLAVGVLAVIVLAGHPEPATTPATVSPQPVAANADRLRDYQDRIRVLDTRGREHAAEQAVVQPLSRPVAEPTTTTATADPLRAERERREYQSLFASNVVVSRRPDNQRVAGDSVDSTGTPFGGLPSPTLDEVADAVIRATSRQGDLTPVGGTDDGTRATNQPTARSGIVRPAFTAPITAAGPLHRLLEGTVIDTVLMNRLDGSRPGPVTCLVTNPVYSHIGQHVIVPQGSRVIGETTPVQAVGETRLAVTFHRLVLPDGRTYGLDQVTGLNQVGDTGLRDQVNHHRWSTFGASGAVGLISGLAQWAGAAGWGGAGDRTVVITGGVGNATSQATAQTMNQYLNRLPTVTIREGHRVKVYLTSDLELPAYSMRDARPGVSVARQVAGGQP